MALLSYDLRKPYKMVISQVGKLIIQNGIVYEYGSGKPLGKVSDMLADKNKELIYCQFSGATFPNTPAGKIALEQYQARKGYVNKPADGKQVEKESTLEERKAEVAQKRAESDKKKGK